ncbi:MAG TPA: DHA2 family efflux MFS transporter permease subunit, partial [Candidatus Methylomirabilis sp.]|nr:DHA2 family efflux MFS transporter permease subunit [Candidatus Methylomirabilis sp.]
EVLDTTVVNVSLPHIAGSLSATVDEATWVLTSYLVTNAVVLPITGWLANYFGRKRLLMTVVTGFTVSSALCGMAPSLPLLIFFRVLQGLTGGGLQPLSQAILLEEFPVEERGKAMAFWTLGIVAAPILGPTLGGWITDSYSWRWVFYINFPIGIISLGMISLFLSDPPYIRRSSARVDLWGLSLLALGIGALQIMLDKGQELDWFGSNVIVTLAIIAGVLLPAFVIWELCVPEPIVHFRLLAIPTFATGIGLVMVIIFVLYGSLVLLPLFMQTLLGWTSLTAGLWMSPRGIGNALCLPLVGYLLGKRWDGRWMLAAGLVVTSMAFFGFAHMTLESGTWDIFGYQITQGVGMAFMFVPLTTLTMAPIPKAETGYATSLYSVMRNIGASMGVSFVTTWIARRSQVHQTVLAAHVTPGEPLVQEYLARARQVFRQSGADWTTATRQAQAELYAVVQQQAALLSFVELFRLMGLLFLMALPLILLMRRVREKE